MGNLCSSETEEEREKRKLELQKNVTMDEHEIELEELYKKYGVNPETGLSPSAAAKGIAENGLNELTPPPQTPWYIKFLAEMTGFFSLLLWFGGVLCFISFAMQQDFENLILGVVLCVVVFLTGLFSYFQNSKSDSLMAEFAKMKPPAVNVLRDGKLETVPSAKITLGDIVKLRTGDLVPADLRVLETTGNCCVDNASLTGESEPQKRKIECTHSDPLETANLAFFGTSMPDGEMTGIVVKVGDDTMMGRIASLAMTTDVEQTPINKEIEHFIHIISAIAIFLGVSFFIIGASMDTPIVANLVFMIGIIVANVPEGLLTTVTVCLTLTAKRMFVKQVMVKNLEGVETLGSTSCICSDKTGTLTQNIMTVAQVVYADDDGTCKIQEAGSSFSKGVKTFDENSGSFRSLCICATLNNTCFFDKRHRCKNEDGEDDPSIETPPFNVMVEQEGSDVLMEKILWEPKGNASEAAMVKLTQKLMAPMFGCEDIDEFRGKNKKLFDIPFNSKYKYQVHVHEDPARGGAANVYMKGAPERIIGRCNELLTGETTIEMTTELSAMIDTLQARMGANGLRVLGFAEKKLSTDAYPIGYSFDDGKDSVPPKATPNFPLGEFDAQSAYDKAVAEGKSPNVPDPKSMEGLCFVGLMALIDPPRPAVPGAVSLCKTAGIKVIMVTGDHPDTAKAIAHKVGILWGNDAKDIEAENAEKGVRPGDPDWVDPKTAQAIVVPGSTIDVEMGEARWNAILKHPQIVFARTSPQQKLVIVGNCQRLGHIVAVTGDGVNDSPAIKKADIGVAMGIAGTPVTQNAADMILRDDNFASIVAGVEEGRLIFDNLKKSICYTLTSNIPEISPFLCYITLNTPLPLSTVLILAIDLGTDMVPAISMAYEEAEADIMRRPPRDAVIDRLVTRKLIFLAYFQIGIMQAMAGFFAWMVILNDYGFPPHILYQIDKGKQWAKDSMYCRFSGGYYVNELGEIDTTRNPSMDPPGVDYPLWDNGDSGYLIDCEFPLRIYAGAGIKSKRNKGQVNPEIGMTYNDDRRNLPVSMRTGAPMKKGQITIESIAALELTKYFEYIPYRARMSYFWKDKWLAWPIHKSEGLGTAFNQANEIFFGFQAPGLYSICLAGWSSDKIADGDSRGGLVNAAPEAIKAVKDIKLKDIPELATICPTNGNYRIGAKPFRKAIFCNGDNTTAACAPLENAIGSTALSDFVDRHQVRYCAKKCSIGCWNDAGGSLSSSYNYGAGPGDLWQCANIASRMTQLEALNNARAGYWVSIVVVQWADLLICKTRWLSIRQQGLRNSTLNFGLFFETLLAAWLCYWNYFTLALYTRPIRFTHWMPGIPWSIMIFMYDEVRKYLMRATSPEVIDPDTKQVKREAGWIELNTYY